MRSHIMSRRGDAGAVTRAVLPAAGVVQLVEKMIRNQQVRGSSPRAGSNIINYLALFSVTRRHKWSVYGQHT